MDGLCNNLTEFVITHVILAAPAHVGRRLRAAVADTASGAKVAEVAVSKTVFFLEEVLKN